MANAQTFLTSGLIADYQFNASVIDATGNGNNGTNDGAEFGDDRFGDSLAALYFSNNIVTTGFFPPINDAPRTISGWFNVAPNNNLMALFDYGGSDEYGYGERIEGDINPSGNFVVDMSNGTLPTPGTYNDSQWHQFVIVVPSDPTTTNLLLYIDGELQAALTNDPDFIDTQPDYPLTFGDLYDRSRPLTGILDDMRFYNRDLSADEVQDLYNYEATTPEIPPYGAEATAVIADTFFVYTTNLIGGYGYTNTPGVQIIGGGGKGAQADAVVSNGVVVAVDVINPGHGYTNPPILVIDPPFWPVPMLSITPMSVLTFSNAVIGGSYQLQMATGGSWTNESAAFTATNSTIILDTAGLPGSSSYRLARSPVPTTASATPQVISGFVVGANITSGGSGYTSAPSIQVVGGGGSGAMGYSQISSAGVVTNITMTVAGSGYNSATTTIQIAPPPVSALLPRAVPAIGLGCLNLTPYGNYQLQFATALNLPWQNWNGGAFTAMGQTNSFFLLLTNSAALFRLELSQ